MPKMMPSLPTRWAGYWGQPLNRQRRFTLLMGLAALVAACGSDSSPEAETDAAPAPAELVIQHAFGETAIPTTPARVVVLGYTLVETVVALGVQPVGAPGVILNEMTYLELDQAAIADVGPPGQPNLEKITTLNPDLIFTTQRLGEDGYALLSQIAPTVAFDVDEMLEWRALTHLCGEALGKQTIAAKLSTDYEAKLAQLKAQVPQNLTEIEASVVFLSPGQMRTLGKATFPGSVLADAGLSRPPSQAEGPGLNNISLEVLEQIDGDVMFLLTPQSETELAADIEAEIARTQASPLWPQLQAVQNDQVYEAGPHWAIGSYIAANLMLDDLLTYLTPAS
ncbi:MAG: iron-siderophore ABC transporter substrate-binding protein [Cyanobacteria bacterium P01_D01_bin.115]